MRKWIIPLVLSGLFSMTLSAQEGLLFYKSSLNATLGEAAKLNKSVQVLLSPRGADETLPKPVYNEESIALYNRYFVTIAPVGLQAEDIREQYGVPKDGYAVLLLGSDGAVLEQCVGGVASKDMFDMGERALRKSSRLYFREVPASNVQREVEQNEFAIVLFYAPNSSEWKALDESVFVDKRVSSVVEDSHFNVFAVVDSLGSDKTSPQLKFYHFAHPVHILEGIFSAEDFVNAANLVLSDNGVLLMQKRYERGELQLDSLLEYAKLLQLAGMNNEASEVAVQYLKRLSPKELLGNSAWSVYSLYVNRYDAILQPFYWKHIEQLAAFASTESVLSKLSSIWSKRVGESVIIKDSLYILDEVLLKDIKRELKSYNVSDVAGRVLDTKIECAVNNRDFKQFANLVEDRWSDGKVTYSQLYDWGMWLDKNCSDKDIRYKAGRWFYVEGRKIEEYERVHGPSLKSYKAYFMHLALSLQN